MTFISLMMLRAVDLRNNEQKILLNINFKPFHDIINVVCKKED